MSLALHCDASANTHPEHHCALLQINVATGEQISNKVMHKQYMQAGGYKISQTDIQRLASINEYLVV